MSVVSRYPGIEFLESLPLWDGRTSFVLERPAKVLAALGNPQDKFKTVHVTGTNGKGSVCAYTAAMLYCAGNKVGQFTSPHLSNVCERAIINGAPVSANNFSKQIEKIRSLLLELNVELSYFEYTTVASFLEFLDEHIDWGVIEVGLGGRLDATNAIKQPRLCIITNIGLDHTKMLGETVEEIAKEKAGIIKPGTPAIVGMVSDGVKRVIKSAARETDSAVEFWGEDFLCDVKQGQVESQDGVFEIEKSFYNALPKYQKLNLLLAVRGAQILKISEEAIHSGMRAMRWPGRVEKLEILRSTDGLKTPVILDGAHNPDGMRAFFEYLKNYARDKDVLEIVLIVSVLGAKNWNEMLDIVRQAEESLSPCSMRLVFTSSGHSQAIAPVELKSYFQSGSAIDDPDAAINMAIEIAGPQTLVVITGSLYLIGRLRPRLNPIPFRTIEI